MPATWQAYGRTLTSRFLLGTARYPSLRHLEQAIRASGTEILTVSLRREQAGSATSSLFFETLQRLNCHILPNTAGCHSVREAIVTAHMARDLFETNWIKLEVIGDAYTLQPDPFGLLMAAEQLISEGFEVFPYMTDDLVLAQKLVDVGCGLLMPWASPIGSGQGIRNPKALESLRQKFPNIPMIVDAGIGRPSDATLAMEMGMEAVLLNSAVALAHDPVVMAGAFRKAVEAGHEAFEAGYMARRTFAEASTPDIGKPFWHEEAQQ